MLRPYKQGLSNGAVWPATLLLTSAPFSSIKEAAGVAASVVVLAHT
jgi:hypothetical protein